MAALNFVASLTVAAGATVEVFTAASPAQTATAGQLTFSGVSATYAGIVQVTSSAGTGSQFPISDGSYLTGGVAFYVKNTSAVSATFVVRFASTIA